VEAVTALLLGGELGFSLLPFFHIVVVILPVVAGHGWIMIRNPGAEINRSGDRCRKRISL
jgi:hypothetical protein